MRQRCRPCTNGVLLRAPGAQLRPANGFENVDFCGSMSKRSGKAAQIVSPCRTCCSAETVTISGWSDYGVCAAQNRTLEYLIASGLTKVTTIAPNDRSMCHPRLDCGRRVHCHGHSPQIEWSRSDSNRRHLACKASALPTELRPRQLDAGCSMLVAG
jgi:hypothetical protein